MRRTSDDVADLVVREYVTGGKAKVISKKYGVSEVTVYTILRRAGVSRRSRSEAKRQYTIDEMAFERNTPESEYWIGFMMADGCVSGNRVKLSLAEEDAAHVEAFKRFLGAGHPVRIQPQGKKAFKGQRVALLTVCSTQLTESLSRFGVTPRKSKTAKVSGLEWSPHFWRGVMDGDGTIGFCTTKTRPKPNVRLAGSRPLMEQFLAFVLAHEPDCKASVLSNKSIFTVGASSRRAERLLRVLYEHDGPVLARKLAAAQAVMRYYEHYSSARSR